MPIVIFPSHTIEFPDTPSKAKLERLLVIAKNVTWASVGNLYIVYSQPRRRSRAKTRRDADYEARLERIGDILARGVARLVAREKQEQETVTEDVATESFELTHDDSTVLRLVRKYGSMSPSELGDHLGLSRASVARRTRALRQTGLLRSEGKTSSLKFYLTLSGKKALECSKY